MNIPPLAFTPIRDVWPLIRPGLEDLSQRTEVSWIPEDIYAACVYGDAVLWHENDSFMVLKAVVDEFSNRRILWVWVAYGKQLLEQQHRLDAYARQQGYHELRLTSGRDGWHRVPGWELVESSFRRELL